MELRNNIKKSKILIPEREVLQYHQRYFWKGLIAYNGVLAVGIVSKYGKPITPFKRRFPVIYQ